MKLAININHDVTGGEIKGAFGFIHLREQRKRFNKLLIVNVDGKKRGIADGVGLNSIVGHLLKKKASLAEELGFSKDIDHGVIGNEVGGNGGGFQSVEDGNGLGVIAQLAGKVDQITVEDKVAGNVVLLHLLEPKERRIKQAVFGERSDEGGVGVPIGGKALVAHFVKQAVGEVPLLGPKDVAEYDVVGEEGRGIEGLFVYPIEKGNGALPIGLAGEQRNHEAHRQLPTAVGGHYRIQFILVLGFPNCR